MPVADSPQVLNPGLYRFSGMYGSAWRDGKILGDVFEVQGTLDMNRVTLPLVGYTRDGHKPGRETRDGTIRIQKLDSRWENEFLTYVHNRLTGRAKLAPFNLTLQYDDPDALGIEQIQLIGVVIWRIPVGFSITEDIANREFPISWETEDLIYGFEAQKDSNGGLKPVWFGNAPPQASRAA